MDQWGRPEMNDWLRAGTAITGMLTADKRRQLYDKQAKILDREEQEKSQYDQAYNALAKGQKIPETIPARIANEAISKHDDFTESHFNALKKGADRQLVSYKSLRENNGDIVSAANHLIAANGYSPAKFTMKAAFDAGSYLNDIKDNPELMKRAEESGLVEAAQKGNGYVFNVTDNFNGRQKFYPVSWDTLDNFYQQARAYIDSDEVKAELKSIVDANKTAKKNAKVFKMPDGEIVKSWMEEGPGGNVRQVILHKDGKTERGQFFDINMKQVLSETEQAQRNKIISESEKAKWEARKAKNSALGANLHNAMQDWMKFTNNGKKELNPTQAEAIRVQLPEGVTLEEVYAIENPSWFGELIGNEPQLESQGLRFKMGGKPGQVKVEKRKFQTNTTDQILNREPDLSKYDKDTSGQGNFAPTIENAAKLGATPTEPPNGANAPVEQPGNPPVQNSLFSGSLNLGRAIAAPANVAAQGMGAVAEKAVPAGVQAVKTGIAAIDSALNDPNHPLAKSVNPALAAVGSVKVANEIAAQAARDVAALGLEGVKLYEAYAKIVNQLVEQYLSAAQSSTQAGVEALQGSGGDGYNASLAQ